MATKFRLHQSPDLSAASSAALVAPSMAVQGMPASAAWSPQSAFRLVRLGSRCLSPAIDVDGADPTQMRFGADVDVGQP